MQIPLRQPDDPGLDPIPDWPEGDAEGGHGALCGCEACAVRQGEGEATPAFAYLNLNERGGTASNGKTSFTLDQAANRLTGGEAGWGVLGQPYTVTYAFRANEPAVMPSGTTGFSRFNAAQIRQAELALQAWSDVSGIRFTRVGSGDTGETAYSDSAVILFSNYSNGPDGAVAFAYYPGSLDFSARSGCTRSATPWASPIPRPTPRRARPPTPPTPAISRTAASTP